MDFVSQANWSTSSEDEMKATRDQLHRAQVGLRGCLHKARMSPGILFSERRGRM